MVGFGEQTPVPPPIDSLSEVELRKETIDRINEALDGLPAGPLADGTGMSGYQRAAENLPPLSCGYFQWSKAFEGEEQVGVQIALLGVNGSFGLAIYKSLIERDLKREHLSEQEKEQLKRGIQKLRGIQESVAKDGIAPAENRYYLIPLDPIQPAIVSGESFVSRAHRLNPTRAEKGLTAELIARSEEVDAQAIDEVSGQPRSKIANLQDFRDALTLARGGYLAVKDTITHTPKKFWGRPGLTED